MLLEVRESGNKPNLPKTLTITKIGTRMMFGILPKASAAEFLQDWRSSFGMKVAEHGAGSSAVLMP